MPSQQICAFNGIFLNDFTTSVTSLLYSGGKSYGPIAVFRNLYAPGYQVSEKSGLTTCATTDPGFSDYGLVVQGNIEATGYPSVRGNTYLYGTGSVTLEIPTCKFRNTTSSAFDFATSATKYKATSLYLANLRPDLNLDSNNVLSSIGAQADPSYHVITLNSCNGPLVGCSGSLFGNSGTSNYSSAGGLISQLFNYTGLSSSGIQWPRHVTLVINVR
jgi:choice-of-anchor A domain-containing protein